MTGKTVVVYSCGHAKPEYSNERFTWLGRFLYDLKPDMVIDLGDGADMASLNSYDGTKPQAICSQSYERDIDAYNDSQERLRHEFKKNKKKRPQWVGLEGNHEHRITKAIECDPRLHGIRYGVSMGHLGTDRWFDEYHGYSCGSPSIVRYDGIDYAHYIGSGNYGTAISGMHHAHALIAKRHNSATVGHSHKRDLYFKDDAGSIGAVVGCYKGGVEQWAGQSNGEWWPGVLVKRNVRDGVYEPQFISMDTLYEEYGSDSK